MILSLLHNCAVRPSTSANQTAVHKYITSWRHNMNNNFHMTSGSEGHQDENPVLGSSNISIGE